LKLDSSRFLLGEGIFGLVPELTSIGKRVKGAIVITVCLEYASFLTITPYNIID